ncbi:Zinc finger RING-type [Penicillium brevicompactum]|uniref:Zinc finger RING-type n=1 Tax=Penicillium brevicompactum TaxID=5074 RepID=UPI002541CA58|nr:Zinc finger RING-type [Penicillium brevicompactum]KAJ5346847.1 Zinc finger RING-type [Penicillium brevicompactum]
MHTGGSGDNSSSSGGGDSRSSLMIIVYSIVGVVTALTLVIVIRGAAHAHRYPERCGPSRTTGLQRQSKARGLASILLYTLPIVKFGEINGVDVSKRDIEMPMDSEDLAQKYFIYLENLEAGQTTTPAPAFSINKNTDQRIKADAAPGAGNSSCPICTDDFFDGQDMRALPCSHQFHPDCVDPWLVNVSATCPLCRVDVNISTSEESNAKHASENAENTGESLADCKSTTTDDTRWPYHRLTNYLQGRHDGDDTRTIAYGAAHLNCNRLTQQLGEGRRTRTPAHGEVFSPSESDTSMLMVPAPAHISPPH